MTSLCKLLRWLQEIKLSSLKTKATTDDVETEMEMAQAVLNVARKKAITQVVKMNVIENIVPTVISLKHLVRLHLKNCANCG